MEMVKFFTWDEIYEEAIDKKYGDFELTRKDKARYEVVWFVEENFGFNLEREYEEDVIECVEDWIDYYTEQYNIKFNEYGKIVSYTEVKLKDRAVELVMFYDEWPDRSDKEFDTLDIALNILREMK